jgi:hypothetical protein
MFFDRHASPLQFSALLQGGVLFVTAILLCDDMLLFRSILLGAIAYWCTALLIMWRREGCLTRADRLLLRWGFLLLTPVCGMLMAMAVVWTRHPS